VLLSVSLNGSKRISKSFFDEGNASRHVRRLNNGFGFMIRDFAVGFSNWHNE